MPRSILSCLRGGSSQVAQISGKYNLKGAVSNITWMRKNRKFCQIFKYSIPNPLKTYLLKVQADLAEFFSTFGLTRPGNSG